MGRHSSICVQLREEKKKKEEMDELERKLKEEMEKLKKELAEEKKEEIDELKRELKEMEYLKNLAAQGMFVLIGCSVRTEKR